MMRGLKAIVVALLLTSVGYCQSEQKPGITEQKQTAANETADTYRLDIVIRELQEGKLISTRDYTALVQEHGIDRARLRLDHVCRWAARLGTRTSSISM